MSFEKNAAKLLADPYAFRKFAEESVRNAGYSDDDDEKSFNWKRLLLALGGIGGAAGLGYLATRSPSVRAAGKSVSDYLSEKLKAGPLSRALTGAGKFITGSGEDVTSMFSPAALYGGSLFAAGHKPVQAALPRWTRFALGRRGVGWKDFIEDVERVSGAGNVRRAQSIPFGAKFVGKSDPVVSALSSLAEESDDKSIALARELRKIEDPGARSPLKRALIDPLMLRGAPTGMVDELEQNLRAKASSPRTAPAARKAAARQLKELIDARRSGKIRTLTDPLETQALTQIAPGGGIGRMLGYGDVDDLNKAVDSLSRLREFLKVDPDTLANPADKVRYRMAQDVADRIRTSAKLKGNRVEALDSVIGAMKKYRAQPGTYSVRGLGPTRALGRSALPFLLGLGLQGAGYATRALE